VERVKMKSNDLGQLLGECCTNRHLLDQQIICYIFIYNICKNVLDNFNYNHVCICNIHYYGLPCSTVQKAFEVYSYYIRCELNNNRKELLVENYQACS
jgi:hypothetical protein